MRGIFGRGGGVWMSVSSPQRTRGDCTQVTHLRRDRYRWSFGLWDKYSWESFWRWQIGGGDSLNYPAHGNGGSVRHVDYMSDLANPLDAISCALRIERNQSIISLADASLAACVPHGLNIDFCLNPLQPGAKPNIRRCHDLGDLVF